MPIICTGILPPRSLQGVAQSRSRARISSGQVPTAAASSTPSPASPSTRRLPEPFPAPLLCLRTLLIADVAALENVSGATPGRCLYDIAGDLRARQRLVVFVAAARYVFLVRTGAVTA